MGKYFTICYFLVTTLFAESLTESVEKSTISPTTIDVDKISERTNSYHGIIDSVRSSIDRRMNNITEHLKLDIKLKALAEQIVNAIIARMDAEEKITELTVEALKSVAEIKGTTVIETKRVLNYMSRSLSGNISKHTKKKSPPHVQRLIYGLAQSASEVGIIAGIDDDKWIASLTNNQRIDGTIRQKRTPNVNDIPLETKTYPPVNVPPVIVLTNKPPSEPSGVSEEPNEISSASEVEFADKKPLREVLTTGIDNDTTVFINQTSETKEEVIENLESYFVEKIINHTHVIPKRLIYENSIIDLYSHDDVIVTDTDTSTGTLDDMIYQTPDVYDEISYYRSDSLSSYENENKPNQKLAKLENKARKALVYASDIAYFTAASFISMRRALTASMEVEVSITHIKNGVTNYHYLLKDLAKSAAKQSGKEAKNAISHAHACERALRMAAKYTSQSRGIKSNYMAKRTLMETLPLVTLTKSLASISANIAINSMVEANDLTTK